MKDSIWPSYLKDFLIKNSGAKDGNALRTDDGVVASAELPGHLLLTVNNHGDFVFLHADSHTMPSVKQIRDQRSLIQPLQLKTITSVVKRTV